MARLGSSDDSDSQAEAVYVLRIVGGVGKAMKANPWEKIERARRDDVLIAQMVLDDPRRYPLGGLNHEWAKRVIENEQKAVAKAAEKV